MGGASNLPVGENEIANLKEVQHVAALGDCVVTCLARIGLGNEDDGSRSRDANQKFDGVVVLVPVPRVRKRFMLAAVRVPHCEKPKSRKQRTPSHFLSLVSTYWL